VRTTARSPYFRIFALSLILVAALLSYVNTDHLLPFGMHGTLNDQVGYVSVARTLTETGELRSAVIYPSLLSQDTAKNYPYMPGHYFALASSYLVFGYSALASFLPSLLGYVIAALALLFVSLKIHDRTTAALAAIIFLTFPASLLYACTAMAEMTFVAAGMLCLALFVIVSPERKPYIGPFLLLLPVLFRETGAVLLIPMTALIIQDRKPGWKRNAIVMIVLSVVLVPILAFVINGDRPSFLKMNLLDADIAGKYLDAFAFKDVTLTPVDWVRLLANRMMSNLQLLLDMPIGGPLEFACMWSMLVSIPVGTVLALIKRSLLPFSFAFTAGAVCVSLLATYNVWDYVGVRNMMICLPFIALIYAETLLSLVRLEHRGKLLAGVLTCGLLLGGTAVWSVFDSQERLNRLAEAATTFLEKAGHDDGRLLVSPYWLSLPYVSRHHPVQWSFVPANKETLRLLGEKYDIGTIVVPFDHPTVELKREDVVELGFKQVGKGERNRFKYSVFRRPARPN
jgi:4-amino-4-deoxy-L-arabinose transferase-like glycosyltransferase